MQLFHRNSCKIVAYCFRETRRGGLVRPASKSCRFSHHPLRVPKAWHKDFAACGQRSGLLALNLANIFEKMLDQKTFYSPAAQDWKPNLKNNLLRKCGLLAHISAAFLKNCCTEKLFSLPAACILQPPSKIRFSLLFTFLLLTFYKIFRTM